jgi:MoxR-like ATPase
MPSPASPPSPERLRALLAAIGAGLLERDATVRLALLAALAGEHVLLIGPPGTAKSALARRVHLAFAGARYFERLLTRFSTPEELFGPLSLKALESDRYERLTEGFLPTAGIAFLDEVFKANSAILNALLTLLNERCFDNGTARLVTPLVAVVAASNEVPADEALHAFYDRFLVRVPVAPVGDASFAALLALPDADIAPPAEALQPAECAALSAAAQQVALGEDFIAGCAALRGWLAARDKSLSDRRWRQFVGLARTAAASEGRAALDVFDLWLAPFVASAAPADVPALEAWFVDEGVRAPPTAAPWLERAVEAFEKQLGLEQQMPAEGGDDAAGKLALARAIGMVDAAGPAPGEAGMQRIVSARLEARLQRRWSAVHIEARIAQVSEIEAQVAQARREVAAEADALARALATRLWMPVACATALQARPAAALVLLDGLAARLAAVRAGFAGLPPDDEASEAVPPAPVALDAEAA